MPQNHRQNFSTVFAILLEEVSEDYISSLRVGTVNLMVRNPDLERSKAAEAEDKASAAASLNFSDKNGDRRSEFLKTRKKIRENLHVLHPALRQSLSLCKDNLNTITLADCECYTGEAIDLDSFCGNIISECEKTEETLMNTWFKKIAAIFDDKKRRPKGERRLRFYKCASVLLSIQLRDLLVRSVVSYVDIFADRRKLPRIEMDLVLQKKPDGKMVIAFAPSIKEVGDMIVSVVLEMNKLLREVPTMESWVSTSSSANNSFVQVN